MPSDNLNFSQRAGLAALPTQMRANELSPELRARLWAVIHTFIDSSKEAGGQYWVVAGSAAKVLRTWWILGEHKPIDEWSQLHSTRVKEAKHLFYDAEFNKLFDFLEFLLASNDFPTGYKNIIVAIFVDCRAAWRVIDGIFVPVSTAEEGESIVTALAQISDSGPKGARSHFKISAERLSSGKWADSIRESIHGVEATAKSLGGGETLADALKKIQKGQSKIHPALLKGFLAIYGYTSDEKGVRHSMVDEPASDVGEKEAIFMFGACASFAQYLIRMAHEAA